MLWAISRVAAPTFAALREKGLPAHLDYLRSQKGILVLSGGTVIVLSRFDPLRCLELIDEHRVDWALFVPTMMQRIWRLPEAERARFASKMAAPGASMQQAGLSARLTEMGMF